MLLLITEVETKKQAATVAVPLPPPLAEAASWGFKRMSPHFHLFAFSPFGNQTLRTKTFKNNCIYRGNKKVTIHSQGKDSELRPEKTLSLHLRLGKRENLIFSYHIIRFKCPVFNKTHRHTKKLEHTAH